MERLFLIVVAWLLTSCTNSYYIVRHAEKAQPSSGVTMVTTNDPPLSSEGEERARALQETLRNERIGYVFSTDTKRTLSTAGPVAETFSLTPIIYGRVDSGFINRLKALRKNTLVVGHSNTVDDIVNGLTGSRHIAADLPDPSYDNLYIIEKKGRKMKFLAARYGALSR